MTGQRILIVDDERDLLTSMDITLRRSGYDIVPVDNGADAYVEIIVAHERGNQFDLLITDHHLPVLSGVELIDRLLQEGIRIPFGVITAFGTNELISELVKRGSLFCLDKPFSIAELQKIVSLALLAARPTFPC